MEDRGDYAAVPLRRVSPTADRSFADTTDTSDRSDYLSNSPFVTGENCARDAGRCDTRLRINHISPRSFAWGRCVRGNMADRTATVQMLRWAACWQLRSSTLRIALSCSIRVCIPPPLFQSAIVESSCSELSSWTLDTALPLFSNPSKHIYITTHSSTYMREKSIDVLLKDKGALRGSCRSYRSLCRAHNHLFFFTRIIAM